MSSINKEVIRAASLDEPHERTIERLIRELEANAELRERLRFHDTFLSTLREACLVAQGIQKDVPLGVRAVSERGLRIIFDKE